jgi:nitronate monooxygenase/enoyl-[acyl-carrier protein] reductase II
MLRTELCELVGIQVPVIQAGMSVFTSPSLAAAVSNAGGLGSLGAWQRPVDQLRRDIRELRDATDRPFAVNHVVPDVDPAAFAVTLEVAPAVVSFALDDAGDLMKQVHDAGSLVMQQVTTVQQAEAAAHHQADIIVAQGMEAGGYGGNVSTLALVPQVVDAVRPLTVVAAGGMADGRGLAAALVLGAAGVNLGTRFLASQESPIGDDWKRAILESPSEAWVQLDFFNEITANPGTLGYGTRLRALRTPFTDKWQQRGDEVRSDPGAVIDEIAKAEAEGELEKLLVVGGQSAGLVVDLPPAAEIVRAVTFEAEEALSRAAGTVS